MPKHVVVSIYIYIYIYSGFVTAGAVFRILPAMISYSPSPRVVGS